jgi:ABC-2 type transport system permease protein
VSTATAPAGPSAAAPDMTVRRPTFGNALACELTKIRTVKSTYWTIFASMALSIGLSAALSGVIAATWDDATPQDKASFDAASFGMIGINFGVLVLAVLGVMVITSEYATGMIRTSLTAVPRRARFLFSKGLVLAAVAFVVGQLSAFTSFFISQAIFSSQHIGASITDPGMLRAVFGGGVYLMLVTLLAYGIGTLLRHTAGAITVIVAVMFVLPIITNIIPGSLGRTVTKFIPSSAGSAITLVHDSDAYLSPFGGFAVFCLYIAAVLFPAYLLFLQRDA